MTVFPRILAELDAGLCGQGDLPSGPAMLAMAETVLEAWLEGRGEPATQDRLEGFRLLALHRQGCRGVPSFNACRETCREIVFRHNVAAAYADDAAESLAQRRLMAMTVTHLALFVGGKMAAVGLGDFCCSARPLHAAGAA